jgi:nucleotidyltransferase/DNA polymerase involved in DNA repair
MVRKPDDITLRPRAKAADPLLMSSPLTELPGLGRIVQ